MKTARYGIDDRPIFVIDQSRCIGCQACVQASALGGACFVLRWPVTLPRLHSVTSGHQTLTDDPDEAA